MSVHKLLQAKITSEALQYMISYKYYKVRKLTVYEELILSLYSELFSQFKDHCLYQLTNELSIDSSFIKKSLSDLVEHNSLNSNTSDYLSNDELKVSDLSITNEGKKFYLEKLVPGKMLSKDLTMFYSPIFSGFMIESDIKKYQEVLESNQVLGISWTKALPKELKLNNEQLNSMAQQHLVSCSWFTQDCKLSPNGINCVKQNGEQYKIGIWFSISVDEQCHLQLNSTTPSVQGFFERTEPTLVLNHILRPLFNTLNINEVSNQEDQPQVNEHNLFNEPNLKLESIEHINNDFIDPNRSIKKLFSTNNSVVLLISFDTYMALTGQDNDINEVSPNLLKFIKSLQAKYSSLPYVIAVLCPNDTEQAEQNHKAYEHIKSLEKNFNKEFLGWIFLSQASFVENNAALSGQFVSIVKRLNNSLLILNQQKRRALMLKISSLNCTYDDASFLMPVCAQYEAPYYDIRQMLKQPASKLNIAQAIAYSNLFDLNDLANKLAPVNTQDLALLAKATKRKLPNVVLDNVVPIASPEELLPLNSILQDQAFSLSNCTPEFQQQLLDNILVPDNKFALIQQFKIKELGFLQDINEFLTKFNPKNINLDLLNTKIIDQLQHVASSIMELQERFSHLDLSLFNDLVMQAQTVYSEIFATFAPITPEQKYAVFDTNYVINHSQELKALSIDRTVIIPNTVILELDKLKSSSYGTDKAEFLLKVRSAIAALDNLASDKTIENFRPNLINLVVTDNQINNDDKIICVALRYCFNDVVFYSEDRNCNMKAEQLGITTVNNISM